MLSQSNRRIAKYLKKQRQPDNETWSINGIQHEKYFLQKLCRKWSRGSSSRPLFIFTNSLIWGKIKWSAV